MYCTSLNCVCLCFSVLVAADSVDTDPWKDKCDKSITKLGTTPQRKQSSGTLPNAKASPPTTPGLNGSPALVETNTVLFDPGKPLGFSVLSKVQEDSRGAIRYRHVVHAVMDAARGQAHAKGVRCSCNYILDCF